MVQVVMDESKLEEFFTDDTSKNATMIDGGTIATSTVATTIHCN